MVCCLVAQPPLPTLLKACYKSQLLSLLPVTGPSGRALPAAPPQDLQRRRLSMQSMTVSLRKALVLGAGKRSSRGKRQPPELSYWVRTLLVGRWLIDLLYVRSGVPAASCSTLLVSFAYVGPEVGLDNPNLTCVFAQSVLQRHCARLLFEAMVHSNQAASQDLRFVTVHLLPPVLAYWVDFLKHEPAARETLRAAGPVAYIETDDEHMSNTLVGLLCGGHRAPVQGVLSCMSAWRTSRAAREREPRCAWRQTARLVSVHCLLCASAAGHQQEVRPCGRLQDFLGMLAKHEGEDVLLACCPLDFITGYIAFKTESARRGASITRLGSIKRGCRKHLVCGRLADLQRAQHLRCAGRSLCTRKLTQTCVALLWCQELGTSQLPCSDPQLKCFTEASEPGVIWYVLTIHCSAWPVCMQCLCCVTALCMGRQSAYPRRAATLSLHSPVASTAARPSHTQRGLLSTLPSASVGDQDSSEFDQCIAANCQLAVAAPRLAQLMATPDGALHQLADLAFAACKVQTVLRIMHSFAHALQDPQARGPPMHLCTDKTCRLGLCMMCHMRTLRPSLSTHCHVGRRGLQTMR